MNTREGHRYLSDRAELQMGSHKWSWVVCNVANVENR
jgi:hypothetical protein